MSFAVVAFYFDYYNYSCLNFSDLSGGTWIAVCPLICCLCFQMEILAWHVTMPVVGVPTLATSCTGAWAVSSAVVSQATSATDPETGTSFLWVTGVGSIDGHVRQLLKRLWEAWQLSL